MGLLGATLLPPWGTQGMRSATAPFFVLLSLGQCSVGGALVGWLVVDGPHR
jgi:hypothetical protein